MKTLRFTLQFILFIKTITSVNLTATSETPIYSKLNEFEETQAYSYYSNNKEVTESIEIESSTLEESKHTLNEDATSSDIIGEDTEINDLLEIGNITNIQVGGDNYEEQFNNKGNKIGDKKEETEWIESSGDKINEDYVVNTVFVEENSNLNGKLQNQTGIILAVFFVILAGVGYILLMLWRRYLEHKYGSRELLVEDDDLKHFSI